MTPAMLDLGRRAVACARWRWWPGCAWVDASGRPGAAALGHLRGRINDAGQFVDSNGYEVRWIDGAVPDLDDPATRGCLLALVREAWNEPTLSIAWAGGSWYVVQKVRNAVEALRPISEDTEPAALVAALEAAP